MADGLRGILPSARVMARVEHVKGSFMLDDGSCPAAAGVRVFGAACLDGHQQLLPVDEVSGDCVSPFKITSNLTLKVESMIFPIPVIGDDIAHMTVNRFEMHSSLFLIDPKTAELPKVTVFSKGVYYGLCINSRCSQDLLYIRIFIYCVGLVQPSSAEDNGWDTPSD